MKITIKEEYYELIDKLEKVQWEIDGECSDIDCDKYIYRDCLKKSFKPTLEHNFSCMAHVKHKKKIYEKLLGMKKYRKYRYKKCWVCKKMLDTLGDKAALVSFTKLTIAKKIKGYQLKIEHIHKKCVKKVKVPKGWKEE